MILLLMIPQLLDKIQVEVFYTVVLEYLMEEHVVGEHMVEHRVLQWAAVHVVQEYVAEQVIHGFGNKSKNLIEK